MERPVLFKDDMVRAILEDRKTQTRRIMKPQPVKNGAFWEWAGAGWSLDHGPVPVMPGHSMSVRCPYGQPGDRLWVREKFATHFIWDKLPPGHIDIQVNADNFFYSDGTITGGCEDHQRGKWRPSIHMPRWASRITLEITGVRVERLQDISGADAEAEGVEPMRGGYWRHYNPGWTQHTLSARGSFATLWESINGTDSWDANPWVWVVEFRRVD